MTFKKIQKTYLSKTVLGIFFVLFMVISGLFGSVFLSHAVFAVPEDSATEVNTTEANPSETNTTTTETITETESTTESTTETTETATDPTNSSSSSSTSQTNSANATTNTDNCQDSLGAIGWLVCPTTGKLAEAVDWLYDKLEGILVLNPVEAKDGAPIYEIWKYCLGLTNIVFVIFVLIVIYSQITGLGISNYGIKRSLPKLIVAAILVNLSFLICALAVDLSNIVGMGIRTLFENVESSVAASSGMSMNLSLWDQMLALVGGGAVTVGAAVVAFETGAIWMLIPVVLGALVAVVAGLITIALRQAVVVLLIMIAPLAIVACILPNTEQWYNKWKQLFFRMLIFYPMFSLLFGASSLAGFGIIASAKDGFGLLLGAAVQTFPLFFAWSLMKMSGTFLETINAKIRGIGARPVAASHSTADFRRQLSKQKHLAGRPYTPSLRLMQFMANRRVASETDLSNYQQTVRNRGLAYRANRHYDKNGIPTRQGERDYAAQATNLKYQRDITRDQNNFNKGLGYLATAGTKKRTRLDQLDLENVNASDYLKAEQARGERIEYANAAGFHRRMEAAINAHLDMDNGFTKSTDALGNEILTPRSDYKFHSEPGELAKSAALARYNAINKIMENDPADVQYVAATAAQKYDTQHKIAETKMQKYFDLTVPTREVELKLSELTKSSSAIENIDAIIPGLRVLNQRGDLDLVRMQIENILDHGVELGTHASQALGNFLMFEVKDGDPFLRRFGKYINLETAQVYNNHKRLNPIVTIDEFVTGEYQQINPTTGQPEVRHSKMSLPVLMLGTPLDNFERKSLQNLEDMLIHAYSDSDGKLDIPKYLDQRDAVENAMAPQFISASLKYLSGSDQIRTMVSFLTGYDADGHARWEPGGDLAAEADLAERYFRRRTLKYLNDQTPNNILSLRSDYYAPLVEHLSKAYLEENTEKWDPEAKEEHSDLLGKLAKLQTKKYDDNLSPEQIAELRQADLQELKHQMAGAEFRHLLDEKGKLDQIYRTRTSSASNNAKDWVRDWLNLNDDQAIRRKLKSKHRKESSPHSEADTQSQPAPTPQSGFDANDRAFFAAEVQSLWDDWQYQGSANPAAFYEQSRDYVQTTLGDLGDVILKQYQAYYEEHAPNDAAKLRDYLMDLLQDPANY